MGDRLAGRVAIVTGAGRGIGRGHALLLAEEGASVVVNDYGGGAGGELDGEAGPADEVVATIKDAGGQAVANYDSVADMAAGERMVQQALDGFGRLDILVNNAGILRDRMVFNMTEEEWDVVVAVHLKGHFTVTKYASQVFRQQRSGRIVGTSSESGLGNMGQANYAAAKEGIVGLTRTLARDLGRYGVTANAIRPRAGTRLTLTEELAEAQRRARAAGLASGDAGGLAFGGDREAMMAPENVSPFVVWLCSDAAANVNGRTFLVWGNEVGMYNEPRVESSIFATGPSWTLDELDRAAAQSYLASQTNLWPVQAPRT